MAASELSPEELFEGHPDALAAFAAVREVIDEFGDHTVAVSKSQVAFRRRRGFAYVWRPGQYVRSSVPAVLSIALPGRLRSSRFKEVVHPASNTWMHHLEVRGPHEIDAEVRAWLAAAYGAAG